MKGPPMLSPVISHKPRITVPSGFAATVLATVTMCILSVSPLMFLANALSRCATGSPWRGAL